jgi:hypothetical protein
MNKYLNHGYTISHLLDCGVDKSLMLEQDFVDLMTQHRPDKICNVNYTMSSDSRMSSKSFSAMSTKLFVQ